MYYNDVHILSYLFFAFIGIIEGYFLGYITNQLSIKQKILSIKNYFEYKRSHKTNFIFSFIVSLLYLVLLYKFGMPNTFYEIINILKYLVLTPMLLCVIVIDYKLQIIPNRLVLTMFEVGLIFAFIYGFANINVALNLFLGMITGGGIFLLITLLSGFIVGKETMGFGDVKLMGALGLFFGFYNIIIIAVIAFLLSAIISLFLMITKIKKFNEYIPFGPFISIASFICIFVPFDILLFILLKIFTLGMY